MIDELPFKVVRAKGATVARIRALRAQGLGMVAIARKLKCGSGTVQRALRDHEQ
jgi:hypothetical protein